MNAHPARIVRRRRDAVANPLQIARVAPPRAARVFARPAATPPENRACARFALRSDSGASGTRARGAFALRAAPAAADGNSSERWMQVFPGFGEDRNPLREGGKTVSDAVIVIDQQAYDNMLADCAERAKDPAWPGYLIDIDHFSAKAGQPSAAAGWARRLEQRDDGLYALCALNAEGVRVTDEKIYLYRSPEFDLEKIGAKRYRPSRLCAIALTNRPAYDLKPASAARAAANPKGQTMTPEEIIAEIRKKLGLDEAADVVAAVDQLVADRAQAAEAQRTRDCDAFIEANKDAIRDAKAFRTAYMKDPENAKALFGTLRPATAARRLDASQVRQPAPAAPDSDASARRSAVQAEVRRLNGQGITGLRALQMAERTCGIG